MSFKQVIELADLLDDGRVTGEDVVKYVTAEGNVKATCTTVTGAKGSTDFVKFLIPGKNGKTKGGTAPTLGIVGRLGGLGARPERIGFTSDGDGALAASAIAAKLARMTVRGDELEGDVIVGTHICPDAPTLPHKPAPFMDSPVTMDVLNKEEIDPAMDAILSIDTTKGNQIICHNGIAISPFRRPPLHHERHDREAPGHFPDHTAGHHALRQRALPHEFHPAAVCCRTCAGRRHCHHDGNRRPRLRHRRNTPRRCR